MTDLMMLQVALSKIFSLKRQAVKYLEYCRSVH